MFAAYVCIVLAALAAADAKKIVPIIEKPTPAVDPIDCSRVRCAFPKCEPGYRATTVDGNCCPSCEPCPFPLLRCPMIVCSSLVYNKDDPCACPQCIMDWEEKDPTKPPPITDTLPPPTKPPSPPTDPTRETTETTRHPTTPTASAETSTKPSSPPIPPTDPTRETTETTEPPMCDVEGQVFTECGSACPPVCGEAKLVICTECVAGCQCPRGTMLDKASNRCVTECPTVCDVEGQVFTECGSACPRVCGEAMREICTLQCVAGCQCPRGTMLDKASNQCVTECPTAPPTTATTDRCNLEPDVGRCRASMRRYYYNAASGLCTLFAYGGCGGNTNNFRTPEECQDTCMTPCKCRVMPHPLV